MAWAEAKAVIGEARVTLGPQASQQWLHAPEHLAMVLARYRAAAALVGSAETVLEIGCGEGIGACILAKGRRSYWGVDTDAEALEVARAAHGAGVLKFGYANAVALPLLGVFGAVVALDLIEHLDQRDERAFMASVKPQLADWGVCVIGTPNAAFDHLASPQSKAGHVNTYTHDRLHALMRRHFRTVQSFGMQDMSLHLGHPEARHYLLMCGVGPR